MSLTGAFQIGHSALTASQLAIQVAGNNLANAATPGYSRQVAHLRAVPGAIGLDGLNPGRGVLVSRINRQVDSALRARLWSGISEEHAADHQLRILTNIETRLNELSGHDLSSELNEFFSAWSELANLTDSGALVVQQGEKIAQFMRRLRDDLVHDRALIDEQIASGVRRADELLREIADVNETVGLAEIGPGEAAALRDQRDRLIDELSSLVDVTAIEQANGQVDLHIGSVPVLLGTDARGIEFQRRPSGDGVEVGILVRADGSELNIGSGSVGSMLANRDEVIDDALARLDGLAAQLIFQMNRIHSTGTNESGLGSTTSALGLGVEDRALALNDPDNQALSGLPFQPVNGGFLVHITHEASGSTQTVRIDVDLDGIDASGAAGFNDDTTAEDIRAALDAIDTIDAGFTADGRLKIDAIAGYSFSFSDDSSGVLATLGVNSYFNGTDAQSIEVNGTLRATPSMLLRGRIVDGDFVENGNAMAVLDLQQTTLDALSGETLQGSWSIAVQNVAIQTDSALTRSDATRLVRESLEAQHAAISGVSVDEESIDLLNFQRQYQGAARFVSVVDQLTQTLLTLV